MIKKFLASPRLRNPYFWIGIIALLFSATGIDIETLTTWNIVLEDLIAIVQNPFRLGSFVVALIGIIINPSTKGLKD